jgi:hypothetical protein
MDEMKEQGYNRSPEGSERPTVYRSGDSLVQALAKQLEVSKDFWSNKSTFERASKREDLQKPETWVKAVVPTEGG